MTGMPFHYTVAAMKIDLKFAALAALVLLLGFGAGFLLSMPGEGFTEPDVSLELDPQCQLNQGACERTLAQGGVVQFAVGPQPILGAAPLHFELDVRNLDIRSAAVDLSGVDMNMGSYRFELEAEAQGLYRADGTLPVCVRNRMLWQADLWLKTRKRGVIRIPYRFTAFKYKD